MKKIPTLFERQFANHRVVGITDNVTPGMEWVLAGEGEATIKWDGSCCAVIDGVFYRRYDAKKGKKPPEGAIPCGNPDPITGHHPHWVAVDWSNPADKWFVEAFNNSGFPKKNGTFEAVGPHFQGNPYNLSHDQLIRHGVHKVEVPRSLYGLRTFFESAYIEGIVFWKDGAPRCKIKRSDFGLDWPVTKEENANEDIRMESPHEEAGV